MRQRLEQGFLGLGGFPGYRLFSSKARGLPAHGTFGSKTRKVLSRSGELVILPKMFTSLFSVALSTENDRRGNQRTLDNQLGILVFDQTHDVVELLFLAAPPDMTSPQFK